MNDSSVVICPNCAHEFGEDTKEKLQKEIRKLKRDLKNSQATTRQVRSWWFNR